MKNIKCPTVPRLVSALNTDEDTAKRIRSYVKAGYERTPHLHPSHDATAFMEGLAKVAEFHGVEFHGVESIYPAHPVIQLPDRERLYHGPGHAFRIQLIQL